MTAKPDPSPTTEAPPVKDEKMDKAKIGLIDKFRVTRTDGKSASGEKHDGCSYFVLDLSHDPHAKPALMAYAESCDADYPALSRDLRLAAQAMPLERVPSARPCRCGRDLCIGQSTLLRGFRCVREVGLAALTSSSTPQKGEQ